MNSPFIEPQWPAPDNVLALSTLRSGGISAPPFDSLNLADHVGDDAAAVQANRDLLARALPAGTIVQWLSQVHGGKVVPATRGDVKPRADASWSKQPGRACAVLTADCLPVLFCSVAGDAVAAAHAGWRGLLAGVLENTVAAMGVPPGQVLAWLGPAIGARVFEVGAEVRAAYLAAMPASAAAVAACFNENVANRDHYFADLCSLARLRLRAVGLERVWGGTFCTLSDDKRFFSYRRTGLTGRMASLVMLKPG